MAKALFPNEQQAGAVPPRKYELSEEDSKPGWSDRFIVGLLLAGVVSLFKDSVFGSGEGSTARAGTIADTAGGSGSTRAPSSIEASEPTDQRTSAATTDSDPSPGRANGSPASTSSTVGGPVYAAPEQAQPGTGLGVDPAGPVVDPASAAAGENVNDLPIQVGNIIVGSGGGTGGGTDISVAGQARDAVRSGPINGGDDDDVLFGGPGNDTITGGDGDDIIFGGDGDDTIFGENGQDQVIAGAGNDIVDGGAGDDQFFATVSDGNDSYVGGTGTDTYNLSGITAGVVVDLAQGTADGAEIGHDKLSSIDNVIGGAGDDVFIASKSSNVFTGGGGNDIFEFGGKLNTNTVGAMRDQIIDFQVGDKIDLSGFDALLMLAGSTDFELVVDKLEFSDSGKVEIRYEGFDQDERTVVEITIDDSGEVESEIELHGRYDLTTDDFIGVS